MMEAEERLVSSWEDIFSDMARLGWRVAVGEED